MAYTGTDLNKAEKGYVDEQDEAIQDQVDDLKTKTAQIATDGQSATVTGNLIGANVLANNEIRLANVEENIITGVVPIETYALLELELMNETIQEDVSYKVTNDPDTSKNRYYHYNGSAIIMDGMLSEFVPLLDTEYTYFEPVITEAYYILTASGVSAAAANYRVTEEIACSPSDEIYASGYTLSALSSGIGYYDASHAFISAEIKGSGSGEAFVDYKLSIPSNAAYFVVGGYYTSLPSAKKVTGLVPKSYSKSEVDTIVEDLFIDITEDVTVVVTDNKYLAYSSGVPTTASSYKCTENIACTPDDIIYVSGYTRSTSSCLVAYYDSLGNFLSYEERGSGTAAIYTDYKLTIPPNASYYAVGGYIGYLPSSKIGVDTALASYTKTETDAKYATLSTVDNLKNYGIRWEIADSSADCERLYSSVGLSSQTVVGTGEASGTNDFDSIYPWSEIKRCNVLTLPSGAIKITYEDEDGYALDGSNGDVFVEIPKFCYERRIEDGYEYRIISKGNSNYHPAFIENDKVLDKIYVSAFEGSLVGDELMSVSGVTPLNNEIGQDLLDRAQAKGDNYSLLDLRTVDAIQNLMFIEHAKRNSNSIIGHGWSSLHQSRIDTWVSILSESSVNRIVIDYTMTDNNKERLFVDADILICDTDQTNIIKRAKITSVSYDTPSAGQTAIYFDGDAINTTTNMFIGHDGQECGQTEVMAYHTGRTDRAKIVETSTIQRDRLNSNRYRNIENLCGNVWHYLPDVTFNNLTMYVCDNMQDYVIAKYTDTYKPIATEFTEQASNDDGSWITSLIKDNYKQNITFGAEFSMQDEDDYFGAFYYLNTGTVFIAQGGGFDHEQRANISTLRAWIADDKQWYLYGCRLIFKPIG